MPVYVGKIMGNGLRESKHSHTPSVVLHVQTERDLNEGTLIMKDFYADLWLTEKTAKKTMETLRNIGFEGASLEDLNNPVLEGIKVEITTQFDEYNGETKERVAFVNEVGHLAKRSIKPCDENTSKRISAKYDAILRNTKRKEKNILESGTPVSDEDEGDGLPF